jgi:hypothetical protein
LTKGFTQLNDAITKLSDQMAVGFGKVRKDLGDNELDDLMSSLQAMEFAYEEMQAAVRDTALSVQIRGTYTEKYRAACNRPHFSPEDIFRQFYGFACGKNTIDRSCDAGQGEDTGICEFGVKKRQYLLDIYHDEEGKNVVTNVKGFGEWVLRALLLAQFHYNSCLPANAASCSDPVQDPIRKQISSDMALAFNETAANVQNRMDCVVKRKFHEFLSRSDGTFFINNVANKDCFAEVKVGDNYGMNVNSCMAKKTREELEALFYDKYWTVVVYSKREDNGIELNGNVQKRCASFDVGGNSFGCISSDEVKFEGQRGRYFHLMYRNVEANFRKTLSLSVRPFGNINTIIRDYGFVEGHIYTNSFFKAEVATYWCWGHPLDPDFKKFQITPLAKEVIARLSSEEGYIAFRRGSGFDRAVSRSTASNFSFIAFNEEILNDTVDTIRYIIPDGVGPPNCDFDAERFDIDRTNIIYHDRESWGVDLVY